MSDNGTENGKKKKKPLKGTGGSLAGSAISEDEDKEENNESGHAIITSYDVECPSCHVHFASDSSYNNHLPCKQV